MRITMLAAIALAAAPSLAQEGSLAFTTLPELEAPPQDFATAEQHYNYLYEQADGGTQHTMETIPVWDGLWGAGNNTMPAIFLVGGNLGIAMSPGGEVRKDVLTPPYETQFQARRDEMVELGRQRFDRLTRCEYPGVPRWIWEPYIKEFVNLPYQSWMMNDFMNETRRVYIGGEHVNIDGQHSATGDSIGFWDEDKLVIWTKWVNPADYLRGMPLTSNQFEMVETWEERGYEDGSRQLITQVTFYDPLALVRPQSAVLYASRTPGSRRIRRPHSQLGMRNVQQFVYG